ncbi:hypothetical protein GCM10027076_03520 [Nocardioides montaniterrae]
MNLQGDLKSNFNTDGRTDGLRTNLRPDVNHEVVDAGAHTANESWISVGEVLAAGLPTVAGDRHPVIRTGERAEIPGYVRLAIWLRDGGRCKLCGDVEPHDGMLHLDHITPWSAGGPDTSDNLRLLCERHNIERSNYIDHARPARPATWWCINCYSRDGYGWEYDAHTVRCPIHGHHGCRVTAQYRRQVLAAAQTGTEIINWHEREPMLLANATTLAYCAHCNAPGMTDQPL